MTRTKAFNSKMDTANTLSFLLSILLLFFSFSHISLCTATIDTTKPQIPSSVTPKTAAIQYWNLKVGSSRPPPQFFLSKLSTHSKATIGGGVESTNKRKSIPWFSYNPVDSQTTVVSRGKNNNVVWFAYNPVDSQTTIVSPGKNKNVVWFAYNPVDSQTTVDSRGKNKNVVWFAYNPVDSHMTVDSTNKCKNVPSFVYNPVDSQVTVDDGISDSTNKIQIVANEATKQATQNGGIPKNVNAFMESHLQKGAVMPLPQEPIYATAHQHFLPRPIAGKIPFSAEAINKIFNTASSDPSIEETIASCKSAPNDGETKQCVSSAEDMIDYAIASLGSNNIHLSSTESSVDFGVDVLIGDVKNISGGEHGEKATTCHQMDFPYLLYLCHSVQKARVYDVEILDLKTKQKINRATAMCHLDTAGWGPNHLAFVALGTMPGESEVCHWLVPEDAVWTAIAAVASA